MNLDNKKILHLTLKKEFFDQIKNGIKTSEYREYKPFWLKRLIESNGNFKHYDLAIFRNGYNKNAPKLVVEIKEIKIIKEKTSWFSSSKHFEIVLGAIILSS